MKPQHKRRLYTIIAIIFGVSLSAALAIYALGNNMDLYLTPSQFVQRPPPVNHIFRMGGMVKKGTFQRELNSLKVHFVITDNARDVSVVFTGILPTLFREGQGIIVQGKLNQDGHFIADQVLAKHDEKYMPPLVKSN